MKTLFTSLNGYFEKDNFVVNNRNVLKIFLINLILAVSCLTGCKRYVEVPSPNNALTGENVYSSDATAAAVLTGLYTSMSQQLTGLNGVSIKLGLAADELDLAGSQSGLIPFYKNQLTNVSGQAYWEIFYNYLESVNAAIAGITTSSALTPATKSQLLGEAKFLRAFYYFNLVNMHGALPLALTTDYTANNKLSRSSTDLVYQQIVSDLKDAESLLSKNYLDGNIKPYSSSVEKLRPTKWAASALLSRIYLFTGKWADAQQEASTVIGSGIFSLASSLNDVFLKNSSEAIWQLQPVEYGWNTADARIYILTGAPNSSHPVYISQFLQTAFEPGDLRKSTWIKNVTDGSATYYYAYKYKSAVSNDPLTEYTMVQRLAEVYLNRSEALVMQGTNLSAAIADLNLVRARAGLPNYSGSNNQAALITAIQHERQVELFLEWGTRWFDLKRTSTINTVMPAVSIHKGNSWNPNWALFPLPLYDIQQDVNLTQNPGY